MAVEKGCWYHIQEEEEEGEGEEIIDMWETEEWLHIEISRYIYDQCQLFDAYRVGGEPTRRRE